MTRTAAIVEKLLGGKWPPHVKVPCSRCGHIRGRDHDQCKWFDPFERIEDAFLVVEAVRKQHPLLLEDLGDVGYSAQFFFVGPRKTEVSGMGKTPAEAIANAAYQLAKERE